MWRGVPTFISGLLLLFSGISNSEPESDVITLTFSAPVKLPLLGRGSRLKLAILSIDNPRMTAFGLIVRRSDKTELGRIAIFPADRIGDFYLPLDSLHGNEILEVELDPVSKHAQVEIQMTVTRIK